MNDELALPPPPGISRGKLVLLLILIAFAAAGNALVQLKAAGPYLRMPDQYNYACIARNLATGKGFAADELRPQQLVIARDGGVTLTTETPFPPDNWRPGWPLMLAGAFRILGATDAAYQALNVLLYTATVVIVCLVAMRLAGVPGALLSAALALCHVVFLSKGLYVGLEMGFCFFIVAAGAFAIGCSPRSLVACCVCLACAFFIRPTALCFFPLILVPVLRWPEARKPRAITAAICLMVLCAVVTLADRAIRPPELVPGIGTNVYAYSLAYDTRDFPGAALDQRMVHPDWGDVWQMRRQILAKTARWMALSVERVGDVFPVFIGPFVLVGLWALQRRAGSVLTTFALTVAAAWIGVILAIAATNGISVVRHQLSVALLLIPFASAGLLALHNEALRRAGRWGALLLLAVLCCAGTYRTVLLAQQVSIPNYNHAEHMSRQIAVATKPGELLATRDLPIGSDTWYSHRKAIKMPATAQERVGVLGTAADVDVVILRLDEEDSSYEPDTPGAPPEDWVPGFRLVHDYGLPTPSGIERYGFYRKASSPRGPAR